MSVYVDLTEFLREPHRTGIQRVTGELCRLWPASSELIPVKVKRDGKLVRLPADTLRLIGNYFGGGSAGGVDESEFSRIGFDECPRVDLRESDVLLCPELFYDEVRVEFYKHLPARIRARCCFIVYDLLPLTHPQYFHPFTPYDIICRYFFLLREMGHLAFISNATQRAFCERFLRAPRVQGRVVYLGSDGLGERGFRESSHMTSRTFVVVGTIEPRKNHALVLDAFEQILQEMDDVELVFLGRIGWIKREIRDHIEQFSRDHSRFRLITNSEDRTIRNYVRNARATIFVSAAEGFGLPPVESLWLGTPVIASAGVPSLEEYGAQGIHIVDPLAPDALRDAMCAFLSDDYYLQKATEARRLPLPDWASFASEVEAWVREVHSTVSTPTLDYARGDGVMK